MPGTFHLPEHQPIKTYTQQLKKKNSAPKTSSSLLRLGVCDRHRSNLFSAASSGRAFHVFGPPSSHPAHPPHFRPTTLIFPHAESPSNLMARTWCCVSHTPVHNLYSLYVHSMCIITCEHRKQEIHRDGKQLRSDAKQHTHTHSYTDKHTPARRIIGGKLAAMSMLLMLGLCCSVLLCNRFQL